MSEKEDVLVQDKGTVITLPKCGIDIILMSVKVDNTDSALLNVEYDYTSDIDKEIIDKELSDIIIGALENSIKENEKNEGNEGND